MRHDFALSYPYHYSQVRAGWKKALGVSSQHLKNNDTISAKRLRGAPR